MIRNSIACLFAVALCMIVGCGGDGPVLIPVSGGISYQGRPAANVEVHFMPLEGRPSLALTDAEGRFAYAMYSETKRGLLVGEYQIVIKYVPPEPESGESLALGPPPPPDELKPFFDKYGDFSNPQIKELITAETRELKLDLN